ncbi:MAG: nucleoside kinase [Patescibacteria group bacterium]
MPQGARSHAQYPDHGFDAAALNSAITAGRMHKIIQAAETLQEQRLVAMSTQINAKENNIRLVSIAGPSSSGKTTLSKRLALELRRSGLNTFPLALDDYYLNRDHMPRNERGEIDFESPAALNLERFNEDLASLAAGEFVPLPQYNFKTGRSEGGKTVQLSQDTVVIIEGIHGLNPDLVQGIPSTSVFRVYVSPLSRVRLDHQSHVNPADTRLIRRIVRDVSTRGYTAADTLQRWASVRHGERQHIFPHKHRADVQFDSAHPYELAVLRPLVEPHLQMIAAASSEYAEAQRLLSLLNWFQPFDTLAIPPHSIMREFVGNSSLAPV